MDGRPLVPGLETTGAQVRTRLDFSRRSWLQLLGRTVEVVKAAPLTLLAATALVDIPASFAIAAHVILVERVGAQTWGTVSYVLGIIAISLVVGATLTLKPLAEGAVSRVTLRVLGLEPGPAGVGAAWRRAAANGSTLIVMGFVRGLLIVFGGILFMGIPTILALVVGGYYAQIATHERRGALDTLRRGIELARAGWFQCLWLVLFGFVVWLLLFVNLVLLARLLYLLTLAITPIDLAEYLVRPEALFVIAALARVLTEPVVGVAYTLSYVDACARVDALDLSWRSEQLRSAA